MERTGLLTRSPVIPLPTRGEALNARRILLLERRSPDKRLCGLERLCFFFKEVSQTYPYFVTYPALCCCSGVLLVNVVFIYYEQRVAETTPEGKFEGGDCYETGEKSCCPKKCPSPFEH